MSDRPANAFLRSLSPATFELLQERLQPVEMRLGETLYRQGGPVDWIYFPLTCLLSVLTTADNGESVETAMIGNEGGLGVLDACGSGRAAAACLIQVGGRALRIGAGDLRMLVLTNEDLARAAWTLIELQLAESRQSGLCFALHSVDQRLARWLMESSERVGGQTSLPLTQEFLAAMLGVQRTTVTEHAGELQAAGLIRYSRGIIEIADRKRLEDRACECHATTRHFRERIETRQASIGLRRGSAA